MDLGTRNAKVPEGSIAAALTLSKWGERVRLVLPTSISVTTTPSRLALNNPKRLVLVLQSRGYGELLVGSAAGLTTSSGLLLGRRGGFLTSSIDEDGEIVAGEWWGNFASGSGNVVVWEVERE